ncbi:MAG TPA: xanthine dehydrogenase family protein subunit M [Anaerolineales bacterium]
MGIQAHPQLPEFDYIRPATLQEASRFLAEHPAEARPLLGGTDLFVRMRDGAECPRYVVDLKNLDGTSELRFDPAEGLRVGAAVNMNRLVASPEVNEHYPLLAEACRTVASYQLRTRATVAGNLCNASPAGDTIGACLALEAFLEVYGPAGLRREPLATFFLGPGRTALQPGDIVTAVRFPLPHPGSAGRYLKLGRNQLSDLAIVGVTALGYPEPSAASGYRFRLALASVAPTPLRPVEAEALLAGQPIDLPLLQQAARLAQQACRPIDDVRGSSRYRSAMVRNLTYQALVSIWDRLNH